MECPACHTPNADGARFCAKCGALLPAATEEADPLIGAVVGGRFRITGVLGEGGMGRVYTGEQQMGTSVRKVAIKTLLSQYAKDPQVLARFMRECGTVSELEHPNTIKVYDFGQTDTGELYIAMELLSGASLEKTLESGALAPDRVDRILAQVCGSLQEAHDKGIVHRDLKPANVYLTVRAGEVDYVKVLDFGIAKRDEKRSTRQEAKLTQQGTVLGTPPYMSPEQFKGQELDLRSDIYSLGVMTYEMLTGRLPFDADTPWAWATQHMTAQPFPFETIPLGSQVPAKMKAAVMRALAKDKNLRQQTVREFFDDFTMGGGRASGMGPRIENSGIMAAPSVISTGAHHSGAMASAQTQIGEPAFFTGSSPSNPGPPPVYQSSPNMGVGPVPTGSGQVYPAAPPPTTKKAGAGPIIGIVAVVSVIGIVGAVLAFKPASATKESVDAGPVVTLPEAGPTHVASDQDAGAAEDAGPTAAVDAGPPKPVVHTPPPVSAAEQDCKKAAELASAGNVQGAVSHYRNCDGPSKGAARGAIDSAAQQSAARGCAGLEDARAAASVGLNAALSTLQSKRCGEHEREREREREKEREREHEHERPEHGRKHPRGH